MSTIKTNQDSINFLTKKVNALYKRAEFLTAIMDDLYVSGNVLTDRQKAIATEYVPYIPPKNATNVESLPNSVPNNYRDTSTDPWIYNGKTVNPSKSDVRAILPEITSKSTSKFLNGIMPFGSLSDNQYKVLIRIWDEIVNKGWYTT
jgi:hypothetical protein